MASFRDTYTREVESLFELVSREPFKPESSVNRVLWEDPTQHGNIHPQGYIAPGAIDIAQFAAGIIPPRVVAALPALPDADFPTGSLVFLTSDEKLYRNTDGSTWSVAVDGADIVANSITAGQIAAAAIGTSELAADAIIANVVNAGGTVVIDADGIQIKDENGESLLTSAGFAGSWVDFVALGIYNGRWSAGASFVEPADPTYTAVTEVSGGDSNADYLASLSTDIPHWVVERCDAGITYGIMKDGSGGTERRSLHVRSSTTGATKIAKFYQDVPVVGGFGYDIIVPGQIFNIGGSINSEMRFRVTVQGRGLNHEDFSDPIVSYEVHHDAGGVAIGANAFPMKVRYPETYYLGGYLRVKLEVELDATGTSDYVGVSFFNVAARPRIATLEPDLEFEEDANIRLEGAGRVWWGPDLSNGIWIQNPSAGVLELEGSAGPPELHVPGGLEVTGRSVLSQVEQLSMIGLSVTINSDVGDYNPTGWDTSNYLFVQGLTANRTMTGLAAKADGTVVFITNESAFSLILAHDNGVSSAATNRFRGANAANVTIRPRGSIAIIYFGSRWHPLAI